jgi:CheY-like chemotaxis protein
MKECGDNGNIDNMDIVKKFNKILIIDDDCSSRILISEILADANVIIIECGCGKDVLSLFKQYCDDIVLVLMDIKLPGSLICHFLGAKSNQKLFSWLNSFRLLRRLHSNSTQPERNCFFKPSAASIWMYLFYSNIFL